MAIVFIVLLFLLKNKTYFKGEPNTPGLVAENISLEEFVNRDIDGDGLMDWEETLIGTDLALKDTDGDGIEDGDEQEALALTTSSSEATTEGGTLTQTAKFSQELFATIAALSQVGEIDTAAAEQLTEEIVAKLQNADPRKIFLASELNISADNSVAAFQKYITDIDGIYKKYPAPSPSALEILNKFNGDGETAKPEALYALNPIVEQIKNVIDEMVVISVPGELAVLHLDMINALERLTENLEDIALFEVDPIVAAGGMSNYEGNEAYLQDVLQELGVLINDKLGNG